MSNLPLNRYITINHYYKGMAEDYIQANKASLNNIIELIKGDPEFIALRNYLLTDQENIACLYLIKENQLDEINEIIHNAELSKNELYNEEGKETLEPMASVFLYLGLTAVTISRCFQRHLSDSLIVVKGLNNEIIMNMTTLDFIHRLENIKRNQHV